MKAFKISCFSFVAVLLAFTGVQATPIPAAGGLAVDFRTWGGADSQTSWTVGTVTALPSAGLLYQDTEDGIGVRGGQLDEIDNAESIRVNFAGGGMNLRGIWLTDIFGVNDGKNGVGGEHGKLVINAGGPNEHTFYFDGISDLNSGDNGELYVDFGQGFLATSADFSIFGDPDNNEYSIAGFVAAPEPMTLLLLGFGVVGLAGMRRFKK